MREYRSADGLTVRSNVPLDWKDWQEVTSAGPAPEKAEEPKAEPEDVVETEEPKEEQAEEPKAEPEKKSGAVIKAKKGK